MSVRLNDQEHRAARLNARVFHVSVARWLRESAMARKMPLPPPSPERVGIYRELARLGNLLAQTQRLIAEEKLSGIDPEVVPKMRDLVRRLALKIVEASG